MEIPIIFQNKRKEKLFGILHLVKKKKRPIIFICHGFGGDKSGPRKFTRIARALTKVNISVFRFDLSGCGDSEGNFINRTIQIWVNDLYSAYNFLRKKYKNNLDFQKVAFLGHSLGATIITEFVRKYKIKTKTLIYLAPALQQNKLIKDWFTKKELKKCLKKGYYDIDWIRTGYQYIKENLDKDYTKDLDKLKIPTLIFHCPKDKIIKLKYIKEVFKKIKADKKLVLLKYGKHNLDYWPTQEKIINLTKIWLKKYF